MNSKNLDLYFREIIYQNPKSKKDSVCGVFSYEALNVEDARLGNIYIVGKISNVPKKKYKNSDFLLSLLASAIKREFYSNHQRTSLEALESALQSANIYLSDFAKKGHDEWIGNLHIACLVFSKTDIYIGQTGGMVVQLFRNGTVSNISKKFQKQEEPEPTKTFSNIASGKIEAGDKIMIATDDISEILSLQKTKELASYPTADKLYHYIKNNLFVPTLACLILEAETYKPKEDEEEAKVIKEESVEIKISLKEILDLKAEKINKILQDQITFPNKLTNFFLKHTIIKYILTLFLLLLIILSPVVIEKINHDLKIRKINNLLQRTREDVERSELSLVYQNQTEAQSFLKRANGFLETADALFKKLPEGAKEKIFTNFQSVRDLFNQQKNSLNNIINITQLEKLADLSKNTYSFNPAGIMKLGNLLYLYETASGFVYKINLDDPESIDSPLVFLSSKDTFKFGAANSTEILLLANPEKIAVYSINEIYNLYLLTPNLENTLNIKDMVAFENNLYFLDIQRLNVFRYTPNEDILNGSQWIMKGPTDELKDAVSMTVDGDVFVARENGAIIQYSQGKKLKEIKLDIVPPLAKIGQIFTSASLKNLYILGPLNNRIISVNKKDGLTKQYSVPELNNLRDIWVDVDEKTIYLLNGLEVYKIEI